MITYLLFKDFSDMHTLTGAQYLLVLVSQEVSQDLQHMLRVLCTLPFSCHMRAHTCANTKKLISGTFPFFYFLLN